MNKQIDYIGLRDLNEDEKSVLKLIIEKEFSKIERFTKVITKFEVMIRVMKKETRKRYILNLSLNADNKIFKTGTKDIEEAGDWDLAKAAYKSMTSLKNEVEHGLRSNSEDWKKRKIKRLFDRLRFRFE